MESDITGKMRGERPGGSERQRMRSAAINEVKQDIFINNEQRLRKHEIFGGVQLAIEAPQ